MVVVAVADVARAVSAGVTSAKVPVYRMQQRMIY